MNMKHTAHQSTLKRLLEQLQRWSVQTDDKYTVLKSPSAVSL